MLTPFTLGALGCHVPSCNWSSDLPLSCFELLLCAVVRDHGGEGLRGMG